MSIKRLGALIVLAGCLAMLATSCPKRPGPNATPAEWDAYNKAAAQQQQIGEGAAQAVEGIGVLVGPWTGGIGALVSAAIAAAIRIGTKAQVKGQFAAAFREAETADSRALVMSSRHHVIDRDKFFKALDERGLLKGLKL